MPIYEFRCNACKKRVSVFRRSMTSSTPAVCPNCGADDLTRLVSRFAVVRTEDQRLDSLDDDSLLSGVDEDDPRSVAAFARKMQAKMGEDVEPEFEEMIDRMEAGETPDDLDEAGEDGEDAGWP
ncbi:MAG: zinc ribbon domain-containing protein [Dehalococcoidia bacterium]|jgi:putative FmdB family regulatory protein